MKNNDPKSSMHMLYDNELITKTLNHFDLTVQEGFRLIAIRSKCRIQLELAKEFIGNDWDSVTVKLLSNGFITMPVKGRVQLTARAMKFLAICDLPINKN